MKSISIAYHILSILALGLVITTESLVAQDITLDPSSSGHHFIVAFPDTVPNELDQRYPNRRVRPEGSLWIFSAVRNRVRIHSSGGATTAIDVEAGKFKVHQLSGDPAIGVINTPVAKTYRVEADHPIILYCYYATIQGLEAWTAIPVDMWGMAYRAASIPGEIVRDVMVAGETNIAHSPKPAPAEILVIAAYDGTDVTFTPSPGIRLEGDPARTVTLHAGQAYQVQSYVVLGGDAIQQEDIAATIITANKPIGVITGNTRAMVMSDEQGLLNNIYKNLMIEWLAPVEQYGREFVFMPTWDALRPESGGAGERKREFVRLYPANQGTTGYYLQPGGTTKVDIQIRRDTVHEYLFGAPSAIYFKTESPVQAMMHSSSVVKFNGSTPCFSGIPCLNYEGWAPYMVTLVPREQWTTFAPHYAPINPGGMQHYINVVTDTLSAGRIYRENGAQFIFTRKIPGTDLIWGSMQVAPGTDRWLAGRDGARFFAYAYGLVKGTEEYRPGKTKKKDEGGIASTGSSASAAPHPLEYEEYNALSYGYPLAPGRSVVRMSDSLRIDTSYGCRPALEITITAVNPEPAGLRSIRLDSAVNAMLVGVDPLNIIEITGRTRAVVAVRPIDPTKPASAVVVITDRTGAVRTVSYTGDVVYGSVIPWTSIDFGNATAGQRLDSTIFIRNTFNRPLVVRSINAGSLGDFTVMRTLPSGPEATPPQAVTIAPGDSMQIDLAVSVRGTGSRNDILTIAVDCVTFKIPLAATAGSPEISLSDLHFGSLTLGIDGPKTLSVPICNMGSGLLTFISPGTPGTVIQWEGSGFSITPEDLGRLARTRLDPGECDTIRVTFTPSSVGTFGTVARVYANTRTSRDTMTWQAVVTSSSSVEEGEGADGRSFRIDAAFDGSDEVRIGCTLAGRERLRIEIYDAIGRRVAMVSDGIAEAGSSSHIWSAASQPSGVYYCRFSGDGWSRTLPLVVR